MKTLLSIFYDAAGRLEPKMILGIPILIAAVVYGMISRDWVGFGAVSALGLGLCGFTALADAGIDKRAQ
jgi:hypothetical protein